MIIFRQNVSLQVGRQKVNRYMKLFNFVYLFIFCTKLLQSKLNNNGNGLCKFCLFSFSFTSQIFHRYQHFYAFFKIWCKSVLRKKSTLHFFYKQGCLSSKRRDARVNTVGKLTLHYTSTAAAPCTASVHRWFRLLNKVTLGVGVGVHILVWYIFSTG